MVQSPYSRRPLVVVTVVAMIAAVLAAAPAIGQTEPPAASADSVQPRVAGPLDSFQASGSDLVRLMRGAFDPLNGPAALPDEVPAVDASTIAPGTHAYWLVQAAGGDFAGATQAITAGGGQIAGFIADAAYIVRATPGQIGRIGDAPAVRATLLYQPGWKLPAALGEYEAILDVEGSQTYQVHLFDTEVDLGAVRDTIVALDGVALATDAGRVIEVTATAAELPAIAAVTGVEWIEIAPTGVLLNAQARWVNDTGVRDVYSAIQPGRLTGEGQTAGVADTDINYVPDFNSGAQSYYRDCTSPDGRTGCLVADYTQLNPGNGDEVFDTVANNTDHRKMAGYFDLGNTGGISGDPSTHGTHVAGSVTGDTDTDGVGDTADYGVWNREDGMAPAARLVHQNIGTPRGGLSIPPDAYSLWQQSYRPRNPAGVPNLGAETPEGDYDEYRPDEDARTHNNSYGLIAPNVSLGSAEAADEFVWEHEDMVIVSSAGNSGPGPGTIGAPSIGKNVLTSGASANGRQPMASIDSMASFSSHGPTPDGRIGVDLATPGQIVISPKGGTENGEHYLQGTSMSGPLLTGLATLVRQYFYDGYGPELDDGDGASVAGFPVGVPSAGRQHNPSAALVRATMVNGAERMRGFYTGDDGTNRALDGQYPSAGQGFGLVNLTNSLFFNDELGKSEQATFYTDVYRADDDAFGVGDFGVRTYEIDVADGEPLNVTLAFTDAPSSPAVGTVARVNNLDLVVTDPNGLSYSGNNFNTRAAATADEHATLRGRVPDTVNPVERVRIPVPTPGTWTVTVEGNGVARGPQGYALAASGLIDGGDGTSTFQAGPPLQTDQAGTPEISGVEVTSVDSGIARVTWTTSEPTTGTVTTTVDGQEVEFIDSYNLDGRTRGTDSDPGYFGIDEGPVETSAEFANKPMVGTEHEVLVTGLSPGQSYELTVGSTDLAENAVTASATLESTDGIYGAEPFDMAQLVEAGTDTVSSFDPITGIGDGAFGLGTQLYAGPSGGTGLLGAFLFSLPETLDPSRIQGASIELVSGHDITNQYADDVREYVDLLPEALEPDWQGQNYQTVHSAERVARAYPETGLRRGGQQDYAFSFTCGDLEALKGTLDTVSTEGNREAAFRFDAETSLATSLFSTEFGFNRRSRGADLRPRLVLNLSEGEGPASSPEPCNPDAPAPTIQQVGVQPGLTEDSVTVSWLTDVPSDSTVLYRRAGSDDAFTQVGTNALSTVHGVQVLGLNPNADYEFGVRSAACNGAQTTDDNDGAGYDFFIGAGDPSAPPPMTTMFFTSTGGDDQVNKADGNPSATFAPGQPSGPEQTQRTAGGQTTAPKGAETQRGGIFWTGTLPETLPDDTPVDFTWYFSSAQGQVFVTTVNLTVFAGGNLVADEQFTIQSGPEAAPVENSYELILTEALPDDVPVTVRLTPQFVNADFTSHYNTENFPSGFSYPEDLTSASGNTFASTTELGASAPTVFSQSG
ncbi:MAG: S8 family serine peptidase, partial [Euzebya sp.]